MRESLNKTTVEVCKTQEGLYFLLAIRCWPFHNPCNLYWVHLRLSMQDDEAQVFDLGPCKLALVMSEIEFVLSVSFQYQMCDSVMLFHRLCKDEGFVQVDTDIGVPPSDIKLGEVSCASETIDKVGNERKRIDILDSLCIECPIVLDKSERSVLLLNEEYWCCHGGFGGADPT